MIMSKKQQRLVTLPLDAIVNDLLNDYDCRTISPEIAEILHLAKDKTSQYHVQFPGEHEVDISGNPIEEPRLWSLRHWQTTSEKNQKARLRSEKEREIWLVKEGNVKLLARGILRLSPINTDQATVLARMMLDKGEKDKIDFFLKLLGPNRKLYTNSKEIP